MKEVRNKTFNHRNKRRLIRRSMVFITIIAFVLSFFYFQKRDKTTSMASSCYSPSKALKYASKHWNVRGYSIMCAEFVSNCVSHGGISVHKTTVYGLRNKLVSKGYKQYKLKAVTVGRCKRVKKSSVSDKQLSKGDVIVWKCSNPSCLRRNKGYRHAVLYSGYTKGGYLCAYAHNAPAHAKSMMCASCYTCGKSKRMSIYSIHLSKTSSLRSSVKKLKQKVIKRNTKLKKKKATYLVKSKKVVYTKPYTSAKAVRKLKKNSKIKIIGYLYNKNGNLWYKIANKRYISHYSLKRIK